MMHEFYVHINPCATRDYAKKDNFFGGVVVVPYARNNTARGSEQSPMSLETKCDKLKTNIVKCVGCYKPQTLNLKP